MADHLEVDSIRYENLTLNHNFKCQLAKKNVGACNVHEHSLEDMVDRILSNTFFSVQDLSQKCSSPYLPSLLKVPIPYDSANPLKRSIYLEMMPTVGKNPLWRRIWKSALGPAVQTGPQQSGKNIVLVTGVSGMGKTKAAYDIGREYAFTIVTRVVELDRLTTPWQCLINFAGTFITSLSCNPPKAERLALKAVLILFMVAHAEYLEDVTKQALSHPQWDHDVEELMKERNCETLEK
eukprot:gene11653-13069_t